MSYLDQLQKSGTMEAVQRQTRQFSDVPRQQMHTSRPETPQVQEQINQIQEKLQEQKNKFDRFLTINQNRIVTLEKEVNQLRDELNKKTELLNKISDRETVQRSRDALFNRKDRAPLDRPVDRNNVAPSQVQIENIFNCSGKKF
jgi:chromosome segregation ATPase